MESLVCDVNIGVVKTKPTVNIDAPSVKKIKDLGDDEGVGETEAGEGTESKEGGPD